MLLHGDAIPSDARVNGYTATEAISQPFSVEISFSTADASFVVDDCLRKRALLQVDDAQGNTRWYDGLPDEVGFVASDSRENRFRMRLRPAFAALEHREGSRIFQDKSAIDVVKAILADAGVDEHVEWRLRQTYSPREFCCQYRETEINFVHRLLEDEGVYYFFLHDDAAHKMVFVDDPAAFTTPDGRAMAVLAPRQGGGPGTQPLLDLRRDKTLRPTTVVLRDFDFEKPSSPPESAMPAPGVVAIGHYEYPGGFIKQADGTRRARARISALRGDVDLSRGKSRASGLACGTPMTIEGVNEEALNGDFVVAALSSSGQHGGESCENEFVAIPKSAPFAAPQRARRPKIRGVQTAIVTGPSNEPQAIHVDKYGRIKVRFLWDRSAKQDDTSSCWIRVSQLALGSSMILPRVGWEMNVAFLEGDPDRPIILGRTYNAEHTPPYAQPGAAADGSMKSMSTPGGAGSNEIKMSDTAGKQSMAMSAQKDMNVTTGNDKTETVAVNEDHSVGSNYALTVGSNDSATIGGNQSLDVGNALQVKIGGSQSVSVGGNDQFHAKCDFVEKVGGTRSYSVGGNQITISCGVRQQISGAFTRSVGSIQANVSLASIDDNMMATYDEKAGAVIVQLVKGTVAENVSGDKNVTSTAAELHMAGRDLHLGRRGEAAGRRRPPPEGRR